MALFSKATKVAAKLRLAIIGPSGSGKTYTALALATALANGKPVAVLDTEHGSASKYADLFSFDVAEMHAPYHPDKYIKTIQEAAAAGYEVLVLDSLSHAWAGAGGVLEIVDEAAKRMKSGNSYVAWKEGTKVQNELTEAIISSGIHIIATMRSKQEYVQEKDNNGRTVIRKVGMAPVAREGQEYEFDVLLEMNMDNDAIVSKSRCPELSGKVLNKPGSQVASILANWLGNGAQGIIVEQTPVAETKPAPEPTKPALAESKPSSPPPSGNPFDDEPAQEPVTQDAPAAHELAIISQWQGPQDAQTWAVQNETCKNEHHAKESWMKSVRECRGYSAKNKQDVMLHFLRHQEAKPQAIAA